MANTDNELFGEEPVEIESDPHDGPNYDIDTSTIEKPFISTKLREWQEAHEKILDAKRKSASDKKVETIEKAKLALERASKERDEKNKKARENNRNVEKQFRKDYDSKMTTGRPWERVILHIDTQQKDPIYKDVSRMRTLLIQLKGDQMAPPQVKN